MSRIRTIKPEFFTSEDIVSLTPLARLFYVSLWCEADREGRFEWKPRTLKMRYLPADDCSVEELGRELIDAGLIVLYQVGDGRVYAHIPGFVRHQVINNREAESTLPAPPGKSTRESGVPDACQGKGRKEGKGKEHASGDASAAGAAAGPDGPGLLPPPSPPDPPEDDTREHPRFARFWEAYPRKVGKDAARKAFAKRRPDDALLARMLAAIASQAAGEQWRRDGGQFIPHPSTWLNEGRWQDEEVPAPGGPARLPAWAEGAL